PGLSVERDRVSGAEGGSVTVQCLYSAAYRNTQKQWCRFKDRSCNTVGKTDTSQNSAVHISDDGRSFSVEIRGLKKSDAGWYWCSAGGLQVPVHISVTDPPPGTKALTTTVTKTGTTTGTTTVTTTTYHVRTYT
ncbi:polymeric immunoglobulin receptor-like, partial [Clarias magur]